MLITHDSSSYGAVINQNSLTFAHTVGNNPNRILIVGIAIEYYTVEATSVTYGGVSLTRKARQESAAEAGNCVELWYLVNPPVGTNNVVINLDDVTNIIGGASSYYGVNQASPMGTAAKATGASATASVDVSSASGELVVDAVAANAAITVGGGQTQRWNSPDPDEYRWGGGSSEPGAATVTMSWSLGSNEWNIIGAPLKPAPVTGDIEANLSPPAADLAGQVGVTGAAEVLLPAVETLVQQIASVAPEIAGDLVARAAVRNLKAGLEAPGLAAGVALERNMAAEISCRGLAAGASCRGLTAGLNIRRITASLEV